MKSNTAFCAFLAVLICSHQVWCGNIDPEADGHRYAWSETQGWLNFNPDQGSGVTVTATTLTGYVWAENTGWIRLDPEGCDSCGVKKDAAGNLTGWGWGEGIGWISFSCVNKDSCSRVDYGVVIDPKTGAFSGYAWSESLGWIRFDHSQAADFGVKTATTDQCPDDPDKTDPGLCGCGTPDTDADEDGTPDCNDNCPDDPDKTDPEDCGCGTPDVDSDGDGTPDCNDNCPSDPFKISPGTCGCRVPDSMTDADGDSVIDCIEAGAPDTDMDDNGIPDANQGNIASFWDGHHNNYITMIVDNACSPIKLVTTQASPGQDPVFIYPCGLISFELVCPNATIRLIFHGVASLNGFLYRKFGPMAPYFGGPAVWYTLPGVTTGTLQVNGQTTAYMEFNLVNGGLGDDTDASDATIVDIGGPGLSAAIPILNQWGMMLLLLLLGGIGYCILRRGNSNRNVI